MGCSGVVAVLCLAAPLFAQASAATAAPASKDLASLGGRAVHAVTGEPIRRVNLSLRPGNSQPGAPAQAVTDSEGKFKFENLQAGVWRLWGDRAGFLSQEYGARQMTPGTPLTLSAGQKINDLEFKMTPQGNISGKLLDEDGEPLQDALVNVMKVPAYGGQPAILGGDGSNDAGEFRIGGLAPGKYVVCATMPFGDIRTAVGAGRREPEGYLPTCYPGVPDLASAVPVEVGPGQPVSGINMQLRKGRVYRVRGKVQGASPENPAGRDVQVSLRPRDRRLEFGGTAGSPGMISRDGAFEIVGAQPGSYWLTVTRFEGQPVTVGRVPLEITDADVQDLVIATRLPLALAGSIRFETEGTPPKFTGSLRLRSTDQWTHCPVKEDLTFTCEGVAHETYSVSLSDLPDGGYLKRVRVGNAAATDRAIELSDVETAPPVELLISLKAATIEGVVRHEGKPYAGSQLVPVPEDGAPLDLLAVQPAVSDQNGRYALKNLPPGSYRIYALDDVVSPTATDLGFLKPYRDKAGKAKVSEGEREQADLELIRPEL